MAHFPCVRKAQGKATRWRSLPPDSGSAADGSVWHSQDLPMTSNMPCPLGTTGGRSKTFKVIVASWACRQIPPDVPRSDWSLASVTQAHISILMQRNSAEDYGWSGSSHVRGGRPPVGQLVRSQHATKEKRRKRDLISCCVRRWKLIK